VRSAVDSSVLLDILLPDPEFGPTSAAILRDAIDSGVVVACEIVWAEVRAAFSNDDQFNHAMERLGVEFEAVSPPAAAMAGSLWRRYRIGARGSARAHLIPDFLVGAHALLQAEALLSRDRGFYRRYFSTMKLVDPSSK
jgi:predicted nucleic acid-binding protein